MTRVYDHTVDVRFKTGVERSHRVLEVAEAFGLGVSDKEFVVYDNLKFQTRQGDCIYITGQSGSGKSIMLRELVRQYSDKFGLKVATLDDVTFEDKPLIDQVGSSTEEACRILSKAGLNDAYLFIRKPSELSDGQRYRLRIAKLLAAGVEVIAADEFGAILDRTTARVVAYSVRAMCEEAGITLVVATTHKDLVWDLRPTLTIDKRFAGEISIKVADRSTMERY
jgi:ABC-type ATPase with predicted acetyltransferase domain